jgi:DNA-binding response OmpR family regulator
MLNQSESIGCYVRSDSLFARLQAILRLGGFSCERFASENSLSRMLGRREFVLLLIDIGKHRDDSEDFVSWLNCRTGNSTPVIALSQGAPEMATLALGAGADDYIGPQCEAEEAIARMRAVIRRYRPDTQRRTITLGKFTLDREAASAAYDGTLVELTPREFTMAWLFFSTPGAFISRGTIGASIWSADSEVAGRTIEQHVYKLRKKLQFGVERRVIIRTSYSQGYRLEYTPEP